MTSVRHCLNLVSKIAEEVKLQPPSNHKRSVAIHPLLSPLIALNLNSFESLPFIIVPRELGNDI